jgi:hypothetical protein
MAMLTAGDAAGATVKLQRAVAMPGYPYAIYELGLAQALVAAGREADALALAHAAATSHDPSDLRLDLGIDRSRALLLEAEILARLGRWDEARVRASAFLRRWTSEHPAQADRELAERLSAGRAGPG